MAYLGASARARQTTSPYRRRSASAVPSALLAAGLGVSLLVVSGAPAQAAGHGQGDRLGSELGVAGAATAGLLDSPRPELLFPFDHLGANGLPLLDAVGTADVVASVSAAGGGEVAAGPDRAVGGHSLRFERFRPGERATPAVVVVRPKVGAVDATEPGTGPFTFGAEFMLDNLTGVSATDNGDNLVQRGLFGAGSQYKIQLDNGHPSCRVAGSEGAVEVRASQQVEPGQWYRVRCRRAGATVMLRVLTSEGGDQQVQEYVGEGRTGSLSYGPGDSPFSIGGKVDENGHVLVAASDQFNGLVDDVVFRDLD